MSEKGDREILKRGDTEKKKEAVEDEYRAANSE